MAVFRGYAPVPGKGIHVRQRLDRHVGHRRGFAQALVQLHDVLALHSGQRQPAERRHDMAVDHAAGGPRGLRLAADGDMLFEIAPRQVCHGRAAGELRRERQGNRFLPGLDARDDERRPLARLLGPDQRVAPDRHPLLPVRPPRLGDIDLAAGRMDPDPEPLELAVPEHGVALDGQRRHRAAGKRPVLQYRHNVRPYAAAAACGTRWAPMLSPVRAAAAFSASCTRCA